MSLGVSAATAPPCTELNTRLRPCASPAISNRPSATSAIEPIRYPSHLRSSSPLTHSAEALAHRFVPVAALLGIGCYTADIKTELETTCRELGVKVKFVHRTEWYFS